MAKKLHSERELPQRSSSTTRVGYPTPFYDPIVSTSSPTLTPFGDSDFLLFEEADSFLAIEDDPTSPEVDPTLITMANLSEDIPMCGSDTDKPYARPFQMGTTRGIIAEETEGPINLGPERPRVYSELSQDEKDRVDRTEDRVIMHGEQVQLVMEEHRTEWGMLIRVKLGRLSATTANGNRSIGETESSTQVIVHSMGSGQCIDEDVEEQPVQDLALNVDNVSQANDCCRCVMILMLMMIHAPKLVHG
ncbi:hypothetical protein Tco_0421510 [Tanacetum coccineum]